MRKPKFIAAVLHSKKFTDAIDIGLALELGKEVGLRLKVGLDLAFGYRFNIRVRVKKLI
ncbi:hypothetical protein RhiirA4_465632 [Rhizophagus irregularis]|uniref:Uncharacterized protein n=1 Tax=Rhizophagus irregularis TaxID=588596 RepID=A0A2I1GSF6_9GLOM|nr:hypothetical protein RhiirA4_465632 [Rhizophagus irregularis]